MRKYIWERFIKFSEQITQTHTFNAHLSLLISILFILIATILAALYHSFNPTGSANISLIYILAVILISYYTDKYRYGIMAGIVSVFCVNYMFTYPFKKFNFTMAGYPVTFIIMYFISILASATTFRLKAQAKKLQEDEKLLMEAEKEKLRANLLRAVSHDLRTPLTSMIGASASYMENEKILSSEEKYHLISNIHEDANWLLHMVENLLSVTRITGTGANTLKKTREPAEEVLFDAISTVKKRYPNIKIKTSIPDDFLTAPMDPLLIKQVIMNLLENAYFHAPSERPIECLLCSSKHSVNIHIKDFGPGIEPDKLKSVFDATPSAPTSAADTRKGMGIGLSICKAIISAHGGLIYARNHENGAEFYFTLPKEEIHFEYDD